MDPFEDNKFEVYQEEDKTHDNGFPDFNNQWMPSFEEDLKSKISNKIKKGTDILKNAANFYFFGIILVALIMVLPPIFRMVYEFSSWAFDQVGRIFP